MILSKLLPDNLPIVNNALCENLGFIYYGLNVHRQEFMSKRDQAGITNNAYYQLIFVEKGSVVLDHFTQKRMTYDRPFLYFAAPGMAQKITTIQDVTGHVLMISKEILVDILNKLPDSVVSYRDEAFMLDLTGKMTTEINILRNAFANIHVEIQQEETLGLRAMLLCWIRLAYIAAFRLAQEGDALFMCHHRHAVKFRQYLSLIDEEFKFHWSISRYAKKLNMTVSTLNNLCREIGGQTAKCYITQRLMKESEFLLQYTELTIIEIAHQLGFKDSSYFSRFFRRSASMTPREYRQAMRK